MNGADRPAFWIYLPGGGMRGPYLTADEAEQTGRKLTAGGFTVWNNRTDLPVRYCPAQAAA